MTDHLPIRICEHNVQQNNILFMNIFQQDHKAYMRDFLNPRTTVAQLFYCTDVQTSAIK